MKKVMIIGKFNEVTKQISESLAQYCRVQISADDADVASGMLKMLAPDLVVVSLVGASSSREEIFALLAREAVNVHIVVIGSQDNENALSAAGYLDSRHTHFLRRPIKLEAVVQKIKELLKIDEEDDGLKKILVVDDNPTLLRTMQAILSKKYRVTFATSGPQAIMAISRSKPDLILLDYDMPVCDGKMTLQMLRSEEDTRDIPVVFLTGMSDPVHVGEVLSLHPQGYLLKPPSEEKIFAALSKILENDGIKEQKK